MNEQDLSAGERARRRTWDSRTRDLVEYFSLQPKYRFIEAKEIARENHRFIILDRQTAKNCGYTA